MSTSFNVAPILTSEVMNNDLIYILLIYSFARVCSNVGNFNNRNQFLTSKLIKQVYGNHKFRKLFLLYHRHTELIVRYIISLKTLLQQGILEPAFYGV